MWAIDYFRLLPTDPRLGDMPFDWLEFLFLNYLKSGEYSEMRERYREALAEEKKREFYKEDLAPYLREGGYSEKEIMEIIAEVQ